MIKKLLLTIILFIPLTTAADTLNNAPVCTSEELLDEYINALAIKDQVAIQALMNSGCGISQSGLHITEIDSTWTGKSKVRIYANGGSIVVWTISEKITR